MRDASPLTHQLARLRLLRLVSPTLPIGSFSWSQGLETAVDRAWVHDRSSAEYWIKGTLLESLAYTEGAYFIRLYQALEAQENDAYTSWNRRLMACRETHELLLEDLEQGALLHKLNRLHHPELSAQLETYTLAAALAEAFWLAQVPLEAGLEAMLWMWVESQATQVIKLLPLGLKDGQALINALLSAIPEAYTRAMDCEEEQLGRSLPGRSLASAWHETQYCRIYRS